MAAGGQKRPRRVGVHLGSLLLMGSLTLSGCGADTTPSETATLPPTEMVNVVHLVNGNVLYAETVSTEGDVVTLGFTDLGQITFTKDEIASIEEVSATTTSTLAMQTDESQQGLVYVNGSWTTPGDAQQSRLQGEQRIRRVYYPTTEEGLSKAQRALEKAIKSHASPDELQPLKETIQQIRRSLADRQQKEKQARIAKEKLAKEKAKAKAEAKRLADKEKRIRESKRTFGYHDSPEGRAKRVQAYREAEAEQLR